MRTSALHFALAICCAKCIPATHITNFACAGHVTITCMYVYIRTYSHSCVYTSQTVCIPVWLLRWWCGAAVQGMQSELCECLRLGERYQQYPWQPDCVRAWCGVLLPAVALSAAPAWDIVLMYVYVYVHIYMCISCIPVWVIPSIRSHMQHTHV